MNISQPSQPNSLLVSGILFDSVQGRPIDSSPIVFNSKGNIVSAMTDADGQFSVELSQTGDWTIAPDTANHDTYYFFAPTGVTVSGEGDMGMVSVQGDPVANAHTLKNYAGNVFVALKAIFEERIAKYDDATLSELDVQREMKVVFQMATNAYSPYINALPQELRTNEKPGDDDQGPVGDSICCTTCQRLYSNNPPRLQQCLYSPPCLNC